jgi:translation initiation factor 3 subunit A
MACMYVCRLSFLLPSFPPIPQVRGWEGWTTESIELHLQTRFVQLEVASSLRLYTEGFRTVEDIYQILQISHTRRKVAGVSAAPPKAKLMATYYEKLTTLFWVSENYLFHAFAWYKFYTLCREYNRGMTAEQKTLQASAVLLSALCIPPSRQESASSKDGQDGTSAIASTLADDIAKEKTARMATLLGFHTRNPTREALLSEIRAKRVMDDVPEYLRELYGLLEDSSNPLVLVERAAPLLERLRTETGVSSTDQDGEDDGNDDEGGPLGRYVKPLTSVLLLKLLHTLSESYHTISLDHIKSLTSGLGISFIEVEKTIVSTSHNKGKSSSSLRVRIDHRASCLRFGDATTAGLESDVMRSQLTTLSKQLSSVCSIISPPDEVHAAAIRQAVFSDVRANLESEHEAMLARKELIEKRKEETERLAQEKLKEERRIKAEREAAAKAEEARRLEREQKLREREKLAKIQREMEAMEKKRYLEAMGKNTEAMTEDQLAAVDTAALAKEHAEKANKKKDEAERKVREASKKLDYIVRATRIEELPLIKARNEEKIKAERERHEAEVVEKAKKAKLQWEQNVKDKQALEAHSIFAHLSIFEGKAMVGRKVAHEALCAEEDRRAEREAEEGKLKRARRRKEDEERRIQEEKEAAERAEAEQKAAEEKAKRDAERAKKEAEEEERRKKEVARMEEARAKREEERGQNRPSEGPSSRALDAASSGGGGSGKYVPPSRRGGGGGGGGGYGGGGYGGGSAYQDRGGGFGGGRYEGRSGGGGGGGGSRWGNAGAGLGGGDRRDDRRGGPPEPRNSRW